MSTEVSEVTTRLVLPCSSAKGVVSSATEGSVTGIAPSRRCPTSPARISPSSWFSPA